MISINKKINSDFILKAIKKDHKVKDFEDIQKGYQIFNPNYTEYYILLDKELNTNELFRSLTKFIALQNKNQFNIDINSFLEIVNEQQKNDLISVVIDAVQYSHQTPWTENKSIKSKPDHNIIIDEKYLDLINEYYNVAKNKTFVRMLQDMPSNLMNPSKFEKEMINHLNNLENVKVYTLTQEELKKKNLNLMLAVGSGCKNIDDQTRLIIAEYIPNKNDKNIMGFVGKGVCFDTGGLNIKTGNHMRWMKYDMSGAAIVGSLINCLSVNKVNKNVIAAMPLVLNLVDNNSYRPDDVIIAHNNKSVEIDNTDAEGRLILADAISYLANEIKVSEIYDVATLTGAMIYALGDTYTGVWTTSNEIWNKIETSANQVGELVWRLPFHHDFKDLLNSKFADICNSVSDPRGGSSRAAMFLKEFTNNLPYTHFDIAGTGDKGNVGTGIMLSTFYNLVKNR